MLVFNGEYPVLQPNAKFRQFLIENRKKSAVKRSIEKPILLNFINLSLTFWPRLSEQTKIPLATRSRLLNFSFFEAFNISKVSFALQIDDV